MTGKRIGGEEAVIAGVPIGWIEIAAGMVENGDAERFALDGTVVVDPGSGFTPDAGFVNAAFAVYE